MNLNHHHSADAKHVAGCAECQTWAAVTALDVDLDRVWTGVAAAAWASAIGPVERLAGFLLGSPGLARALVKTPSLVLSWIFATAIVLAVGVAATYTSVEQTPWVALLAPALAGIGIAYAYGPGVDPAFELSQTMAVSDRWVLLIRVLAVFSLNALLGVGASLISPVAASVTWSWLVPMAMVSMLALATATLAHSANVGVAAALAGWAMVLLGSAAQTGDVADALAAALIPFYALATVIFLGVALYATSGRRLEVPQW